MVWRPEDPQGNEAAKVRFEVIPYLGPTCIDIGCGPNKVFEHFLGVDSQKDTALFGVDMKPDIVGDCCKLSLFADGAFDTVFSSHTLEHIEDYRAALAEWWRLVALGGHLVLYLPHRDLYPRIGQPGGNPDHKHDFLPQDIVEAMRELAVCDGFDLRENQVRDAGREYSFFQVYRKRDDGQMLEAAPLPEKRAGLVRLGAYGDALWASSVAWHLKREGYHLTVYTERAGAEVLAHDPHVDRIIELPHQLLDDVELTLYLIHEARKYQRFVNLTGAVETRLLPHPHELPYHWPHAVRHAYCDRNYLEELHTIAQVPQEYRQRFYPTADELAWSREERARFDGPLVVLQAAGSGLPKTWPYVQRFLEIMAAKAVHVVVVGELRAPLEPPAHFAHVVGKQLPMRLAMTLAGIADVVVGVESAIVNAVAFEEVPKVVLLSHSSHENLTKHWRNTAAFQVEGLACYPCHRLHRGFEFCPQDPQTKHAACMSAQSAELVAELVLNFLEQKRASAPAQRPAEAAA
jgi:ADP-heptose:LPS heptosyltransferase/predicted SAM-dependent methyltransferase